jgi:hypothetical protein
MTKATKKVLDVRGTRDGVALKFRMAPRYEAEIARSEREARITVRFMDRNSGTGFPATLEAELAARIYEVAADLERRAAGRMARWGISPRTIDCQLVIEFCDRELGTMESVVGVVEEILAVRGIV